MTESKALRVPTKADSLRLLKENKLPIDVILDVGVQRKTQDLIDAFPDKKHILFEPIEEFFPDIQKHYASIDHIFAKYAVTSISAPVRMRVQKADSYQITHGRVVGADGVADREVPGITLDDYFAANPTDAAMLLKIDVDGHELEVLKGAGKTLRQTSVIVIEASLFTFHERFNAVTNHGFFLWDIIDLCYFHQNLSQVDLVFVNQSLRDHPGMHPWKQFPFKWADWDFLNARLNRSPSQ